MPYLYQRAIDEHPFPYLDTEAALMLRTALDHHKRSKKVSLRQLSKQLGYKQSAILSHMANGRVAIPLDRAEELADALQMSKPHFLSAVIKQRHSNFFDAVSKVAASSVSNANFAGSDWQSLNEAQARVIREVVRDKYPDERWLTPHEVAFMCEIRKLFPDIGIKGLSENEFARVKSALQSGD